VAVRREGAGLGRRECAARRRHRPHVRAYPLELRGHPRGRRPGSNPAANLQTPVSV
jgi:hypothetical protein